LLYHPTAGRVINYGWKDMDGRNPLHGNEHWLQSCEERKPFFLITYKIPNDAPSPNVSLDFKNTENEKYFDIIPLDSNDVVIFNASVHGQRMDNLKNIVRLSECMENARSNGEAPNWPTLLYMRTSPQHFDTRTGEWSRENRQSELCANRKDQQDTLLLEDLESLEGKLPIIGKDMNLLPLAHLHRANFNTRSNVDCTHWVMPGVPDFFAKEVATALVSRQHNPPKAYSDNVVGTDTELFIQLEALQEQQVKITQDVQSMKEQLGTVLDNFMSQQGGNEK